MAHVGIDVAGDYLLPHDAFDDLPHASRAVVACIVAGLCFAVFALALGAAIREARGSLDEFGRTVRSYLTLNVGPFLVLTSAFAGVILSAMESIDAVSAGKPVSGPDDLLGGSFVLGCSLVAMASVSCALVARRLVRALADMQRPLVRALAIAFAAIACEEVPIVRPHARTSRSFAASRALGTTLAGRAPPFLVCVRLF